MHFRSNQQGGSTGVRYGGGGYYQRGAPRGSGGHYQRGFSREQHYGNRGSGGFGPQRSKQKWGGESLDWAGGRSWPDDDNRRGGQYKRRRDDIVDYEPGEIDEVGSPISSESEFGANYAPMPRETSPTRHSPLQFASGSPISDDEFRTDTPPVQGKVLSQ